MALAFSDLQALFEAGGLTTGGAVPKTESEIRAVCNPPEGYEITSVTPCTWQRSNTSFVDRLAGTLEQVATNPVLAVQAVAAPLLSIPGTGVQSLPERISSVAPETRTAYVIGQSLALSAATGGGNPVALNLGNLFSTAGNILGGITAGGTVGNVLSTVSGGLNLASQFLPQPASSPVVIPTTAPQVITTAAGGVRTAAQALSVGAGGMALRDVARGIIAKMAASLGLRSLSPARAAELIKKAGKFFTSPEAIATYLGVTVGELYTVWTYSQLKRRRRMNPANGRALRRAVRRIKSFHRMCQHTDVIKPRRRSGSRGCFTCRKNPCAC